MSGAAPDAVRRQFERSLRAGTGRAYLLLQAHPELDVSAAIIQAAVTPPACDPQSEGDRADYLSRLIDSSVHATAIRETLCDALLQENDDCWALDQLYAIACIYAKRGDATARRAIYLRFQQPPIPGASWCGAEQLIDLEGIEGMIRIAEVRGQTLREHPDDWEDDELLNLAQERLPDQTVRQVLADRAAQSPAIQAYLDAIDTCLAQRQDHAASPAPDLDLHAKDLPDRLQQQPLRIVAAMRRARFPEAAMRQLSAAFASETDPDRQLPYLRIFAVSPYQGDPVELLPVVQSPPPDPDDLRFALACKALSFFSDPHIRQLALDQLQKPAPPADYLLLLMRNAQSADAPLFTRLAEQAQHPDHVHQLAWNLCDIFAANPTINRQPLLPLYDKLTCGLHRLTLLQQLIAQAPLPARIRGELPHDSYDEIRDLASTLG